ncbi:MAG: hypothetical protein ABIH42_05665, partial [Planctomycetota bacterium]
PAGGNVYANDAKVRMLQIILTAGNQENVNIPSITFKVGGIGDDSLLITKVRLFNDLNNNGSIESTDPQIGITKTFLSDNGTVTYDYLTEVVTLGTSESWILTFDFVGIEQAVEGSTFYVTLQSAESLTAKGALTEEDITPTGSFPITSNTMTLYLAREEKKKSIGCACSFDNAPADYTDSASYFIPVMLLFGTVILLKFKIRKSVKN